VWKRHSDKQLTIHEVVAELASVYSTCQIILPHNLGLRKVSAKFVLWALTKAKEYIAVHF